MAKMEQKVPAWLCCCFRITVHLLKMQTIIFHQQMQTISFSVVTYFKLYILVFMIMQISPLFQCFYAYWYNKRQYWGKKKNVSIHIRILWFSSLPDILLNHCTKKRGFSNRKQQQLEKKMNLHFMSYTHCTSFIKLKSCNQLLTSKKYWQVTDGGKTKTQVGQELAVTCVKLC